MLFRSLPVRLSSIGVIMAVSFGCGSQDGNGRLGLSESPQDHQNYSELFRSAATQYDIPAGLLEGLAYVETRWHPANQQLHDESDPDHRQVYGIMGLHADNSLGHSLAAAAKLIGKPEAELIASTELNIEGGAALVKRLAKDQKVNSRELSAWSEVVRAYSGIPDLSESDAYVSEVYRVLRDGINENGIIIAGNKKLPIPARKGPESSNPPEDDGDFPGATPTTIKPAVAWAPSPNFTKNGLGRPKYIIIHVTEGAYAGSVSWLKNKASKASAHYVIRSRDGHITQMVRDQDRAWHARCWNSDAIGIEHEGFISRPEKYFTDPMYRSSANLVRYLTEKYSIPRTNVRIVGHNVGDTSFIKQTGLSDCNTHTDPGPGWGWKKYLGMVTGSTLASQ